jgi:hypothetical protein
MLCHLECDATGEVLCCRTAYNFAECLTAALELADPQATVASLARRPVMNCSLSAHQRLSPWYK